MNYFYLSQRIFSIFWIYLFLFTFTGCSGCQSDDGEENLTIIPEEIDIGDPYWTKVEPENIPPKRSDAMSTYDSLRKKLVLFGGARLQGNDWVFYDDLWEFDGKNWYQRSFPNHPDARTRSGMCYCKPWGKTLLFGGGDVDGNFKNDTWEFDGNNWVELNPPVKPSKRRSMAMVFDENIGKVVLFGGEEISAIAYDTWLFDGTNWELLNVQTFPEPRKMSKAVYDSKRKKTVLFGGYVSIYQVYNDTWEFDGSEWSKIKTSTTPPGRNFLGLCYYGLNNRTVLFGGVQLSNSTYYNDTWEYDGNNWVEIETVDKPVPKRAAMILNYFEKDHCVIMFGGWDHYSWRLDDTWVYSVVDQSQSAPAFRLPLAIILICMFSVLMLKRK